MKYYGHHKDRATCEIDSVVPAVRKAKEIYGKSYIEIPKLNNFLNTCCKHLITLINKTEVLYINY